MPLAPAARYQFHSIPLLLKEAKEESYLLTIWKNMDPCSDTSANISPGGSPWPETLGTIIMIQASSLRPESTLSLSQAILKTFTRAISFIQRKRGVFFYPCRPALTDYQTHFQSGVFFTRLEPAPIFFRLRRSVVVG